jgi:hypothetical protein
MSNLLTRLYTQTFSFSTLSQPFHYPAHDLKTHSQPFSDLIILNTLQSSRHPLHYPESLSIFSHCLIILDTCSPSISLSLAHYHFFSSSFQNLSFSLAHHPSFHALYSSFFNIHLFTSPTGEVISTSIYLCQIPILLIAHLVILSSKAFSPFPFGSSAERQ